MNPYHSLRPILRPLTSGPALTFLLLIAAVFVAACNISTGQPQSASDFSDKNARMYQMYFDSSADPALNELQIRRFMGHLHMADLAEIFGDISALPLDQACNHGAGPVIDGGTAWYMTATPDLVGVNLVSLTPDGTRSSAFDLDGDRVVDILDLHLADDRRYTFFTEQLGLDVIQSWLEGLDPFCNSELVRQLGLPELGCNETADGSSGGGGGFGPGSGILDPVEALCSEYDTGPMSGILARNPSRSRTTRTEFGTTQYDTATGGVRRDVETWDVRDAETGELLGVDKQIVDTDTTYSPPRIVQIVDEYATSDGYGIRTIKTIDPETGAITTRTQRFEVPEADRGSLDYDERVTDPPPPNTSASAPIHSTGVEEEDTGGDSQSTGSPARDNPGPEGDDTAIAEFCRQRANHRSGIQRAADQDPSSINVSCGDLVGAPGGCSIIEWAGPEDFTGAMEPPEADDGCDEFSDPDRGCEGPSVEDRIRRFLGRGAALWSLDLPALDICPMIVCNPADSIELQAYTAGDINIACPAVVEAPTPTLEPSEENCPPGTYYAPVTNRCIQIQVPGNGSDGGSGGDGGGNSCQPPPGGCAANEYWSEATCTCQIFG